MKHLHIHRRAHRARASRSVWRTGVLAVWLQLALASTAGAETPAVQPLVDPPGGEHQVGQFVVVELAAPDVPGRGRSAVFADLQGAVFGVPASSTGDAPAALAEPDEWTGPTRRPHATRSARPQR